MFPAGNTKVCVQGMRAGLQIRAFLWPADRLKVTLASGYYTARLAVSCSLFRDAYASATYDTKTMLHWCEREVRWASDWLLKTYIPGAGTPVGKWGPKDQFVAMVSIAESIIILRMRWGSNLLQATHALNRLRAQRWCAGCVRGSMSRGTHQESPAAVTQAQM
jgi:hypothetical protein